LQIGVAVDKVVQLVFACFGVGQQLDFAIDTDIPDESKLTDMTAATDNFFILI
jgi:hypothetical protein